jgi:hypothetical protein
MDHGPGERFARDRLRRRAIRWDRVRNLITSSAKEGAPIMDAEAGQLQGTWQAVRVVTANGPVPDEVARRLRYIFVGDRVTLFEGGPSNWSGRRPPPRDDHAEGDRCSDG